MASIVVQADLRAHIVRIVYVYSFWAVEAMGLRWRIRAPYSQKHAAIGTNIVATDATIDPLMLLPSPSYSLLPKRGKDPLNIARRKPSGAFAEAA